jgi:hypothetical protein
MGIDRLGKMFLPFVMLSLAILVIQPVAGGGGTITVAYRGSGESYIGDTVVFDGLNTIGNTTLIKITGPGLPAGGLPPYDLNGAPGSGNTVEVNPDGLWKFVWYTSSIKGVEKMQTARYTFTVSSLYGGTGTASTSVVLKKPDLYIVPSPNPVSPGNYVQLTGVAERGVDSVKIEVTDSTGTVLHSFSSPVGASGYMNYGFHVDMQPGRYNIIVSNPALRSTYRTFLTVVPPSEMTQMMTGSTFPTATNQSANGVSQSAEPMNNGSNPEPIPPASSKTRAPASALTVIGGIIIAGIFMVYSLSWREDR